jgi:hypothetical protein
MSFDPNSRTSRQGRLFESDAERQLHQRGYMVVRHCDQLGVTGNKAPMATGPYAGLRLPDLSAWVGGRTYWIEAKYKSRQAWYERSANWRHGIDLDNWRDYMKVSEMSGIPGFLMIGDGSTGKILVQSFNYLAWCEQIHQLPTSAFPNGGVFWPVTAFEEWGEMNLQTGQTFFDFGFLHT